jgi:hypothetical protein
LFQLGERGEHGVAVNTELAGEGATPGQFLTRHEPSAPDIQRQSARKAEKNRRVFVLGENDAEMRGSHLV